MAFSLTWLRVGLLIVRRPALAWQLLRTGWRFRRRGWYRRLPPVPLPPAEYMRWRLHTAYGDEKALPSARELQRYLRWAAWMTGGAHRTSAPVAPQRRPLRVGLTGNVASGKSSVARIWAARGAVVIDADELARRAVAPGSPVLAAIRSEFGPGVLAPDGTLDRAAMRRRMLEDPGVRQRLEALVHPEVGRLRALEDRRAADAGARVVVHDVPLLFEAGLEDDFDLVVLVDAPEELRRTRLTALRGLSGWEADRLIDAQAPGDTKRKRSDRVIENVGSMEELEAEAMRVWQEIEGRAPAS